jgi:integrase
MAESAATNQFPRLHDGAIVKVITQIRLRLEEAMTADNSVYRRCGCADPTTGRRLGGRCPKLSDPDHGSWYYTAQLGTRDGRRFRQRRGGFRTAAEASTARARSLATYTAASPSRRWTVAAWLRRWLATLPSQVRPSTAAAYRAHILGYLIPYLGHHTLGGLRPRHIEAMLADLDNRRTRAGGSMSAATLQRIRATLRRALNIAIRDGLLSTNPARLVALPGLSRHRPQPWTSTWIAAWQRDGQHPTVAVWTPAQLAYFLFAVRHDWLFALWWLTALRGLRRGELCALRWVDLDLDHQALTVNQQVSRAAGCLHVGPPKSPAGQRTIALDTVTTAVLHVHQERQQQHRQDAPKWRDTGLVFTWPDGHGLSPDWLTHRFHHLVAVSGLPPVRLHGLRHGAATLALAARTDLKIVQHVLGHSSYAFTADTYAAVLPDTDRDAAETTAHLLLTTARSTPIG